MIDSISFRVPGGYAPDLENRTVYRENYFRGMLDNMRVVQSPDGVFCTGSLAGYLQGSNVLPLTRRSVEDALRKLEEATGWDLKRAELFQVEIGTTIQVKNPPCMYLASWGNMPRFIKHTYQKRELETVSYSTKARSFTGYDKRLEAEKHGVEIPAIFSGAELIRLELKYKKGLKSWLGRQLSPWDLADRATYTELVNHWQAFYFRIPKGRVAVLDISGGVSPRDIDNALKAHGLQTLGYDNANGLIGTLERRGMFGRVQATRARKALRDAAKDAKISHADNLTAELDARVREVSVYAR